MARSFKISSPLPRRPSASPQTTPGSQHSNRSHFDESPLSHPGAKAERVLGAYEPEGKETKRKQTKREKRQLRKHPSFMSVTLSDIDSGHITAIDGFPFPGMRTPSEGFGHPAPNPDRQGSSPLLEEQFLPRSSCMDNRSGENTTPARRTGSSSTLRSYYDPAKSPLSISQQTSASSARDMALRKGFPPISSSVSHNGGAAMELNESDKLHSRHHSVDSKVSGSSKVSGKSLKKVVGTSRRRPSVTDPPTLYPNAKRTLHAVSPPPALINSSLPKPLIAGGLHHSSPSRLRWWERKGLSNASSTSSPTAVDNKQSYAPYEDNFSSVKVNVKKPEAGVRHWFDGLEDEEQTFEELHQIDVSRNKLEIYKHPLTIHEIMSQEPDAARAAPRKSSFSTTSSQRTVPPERELSFRPDLHVQQNYSDSTTQLLDPRNTIGGPVVRTRGILRSSENKKKIQAGLDLQMQSFLELSSSEDEVGSNLDPGSSYRCHRIRASIEQASYDSEVLVGDAQHVQHAKPSALVKRLSQRSSSSRGSDSLEIVPPVPRIADRPKISQRTSSMKWRDIMEEKAGKFEASESTIDTGESSFNGDVSLRTSNPRTTKKQSFRGSKLMKVTSEEEKLLEAMREKRSNIRQDDFAKGFRIAMQLNGDGDVVVRPKTAGVDGRSFRSSVYRPSSSISPPREYVVKRNPAGSRLSASTDDLRLEEAYPFPNVPERRRSPGSLTSPSKASPSLSFSPSDLLPSTPTSRNSPLTPPPGHAPLGSYGRGGNLSPPKGILHMNKYSYDRKRTASAVPMDGVEQHNQALGEENNPTRWATDRW